MLSINPITSFSLAQTVSNKSCTDKIHLSHNLVLLCTELGTQMKQIM